MNDSAVAEAWAVNSYSASGDKSSPFYVEGELIFTAVAEGSRRSMAHFVANRCHTPPSSDWIGSSCAHPSFTARSLAMARTYPAEGALPRLTVPPWFPVFCWSPPVPSG